MRFRHLLPMVGLALACQKVGQSAAPKVPEPADLIAVVSVASPKAALAKVKAYADAVSPGASGALRDDMIPAALSTMVGAPSLDGIDLDKPAHLLVLDPKKHQTPVLLVTVADAKKLGAATGPKVKIDGKNAIIGPAADVDLVSAYALGVVAARPAPARPTATSWPGKLLAL